VNGFNALHDALQGGRIAESWLQEIEGRDNLFADIDYRIYTR
jgi:1,4-alpha-glucan branching enzyme